jgi:hypothetical protein
MFFFVFLDYMNLNPAVWLTTTIEQCCKRYYSWNEAGCVKAYAQATLISGTGTGFIDPTADLWYPVSWLFHEY